VDGYFENADIFYITCGETRRSGMNFNILLSYLQSTTNGWRVIFWIAALMYTVCSLPYIICFKAQIQPWNNAEKAEAKPAPVLFISNVVSSDAEDGEVDMLTKSQRG
jgi:hypothetical protein